MCVRAMSLGYPVQEQGPAAIHAANRPFAPESTNIQQPAMDQSGTGLIVPTVARDVGGKCKFLIFGVQFSVDIDTREAHACVPVAAHPASRVASALAIGAKPSQSVQRVPTPTRMSLTD